MKFDMFLKVINRFFIFFFIIFSIFAFSSCDVCQTAEDMETEEFQIKLYGKSKDYDDLKPETYWVSSGIFVNKISTSSSNLNNPNSSLNISILSNNLDLCASDFREFFLNPKVLNRDSLRVFKDDLIEILPAKEKIFINDCEKPPKDVYIHDVEKCRNGYVKQDGTNQFVERAEGKFFEVESYIVDKNSMYNVLASNSQKILPGKKLVIPQEFETQENGLVLYSFFPEIPNDHKAKLEQYKNSSGKSSEVVNFEYWCRNLPAPYASLTPTGDINGFELNKFCDNFYKFDTIKYELIDNMYQSVDKNQSEVSICPNFSNPSSITSGSTTIGNTSSVNSKLYSFISNGCVEDFEIDGGKSISFFLEKSRFLYQLGLGIFSSNSSNLIDLNSEYNSSSNKASKLFGKFDGNNIPQIPLDKTIFIPKDGFISPYLNMPSSILNQMNGSYNFKIKRSCKAKKLYVYFSPDGVPPDIRPNDLIGEPNQDFMILDLLEEDDDENLVNSDKISVDLSLIPKSGWIYFAIADNGDGYENNDGMLNLSIKRPKDKREIFFNKFLNKILNNIDSLLFGSDPAKNNGIATIIYQRIVKSNFFSNIINVFLLMFITAYGIMIVGGLTQFQGVDLTKTALKIGFVYALLMPQSWKFFNEYLFDIFIRGPGQILALILTPPNQQVNLEGDRILIFGTVAEILSRITDISFYKQVISLLFAGPFGWIALIVVLISFVWLLYATFSALLIYIISMVLIALFLSVAPLFIMTLMFKYTQKIFKAWFKVLVSNAMTLIFVFVGLYALGTIASLLLDDIFSFGICTRCVFVYSVGPFEFCMMYAALPDQFPELYSYDQLKIMQEANASYNTGANFFYGLPIGLNKLLALYIVSYILRKSVDVFAQLASEVSDIGFGGPGGSGGIASAVEDNFQYWFGGDKRAKADEAKKTKGAEIQLSEDGGSDEEKKTVKRK